MESVLMVRTAASAPTGAPFGAWPSCRDSVLYCTVNVIVNFVRKNSSASANDKAQLLGG